MRFGEFRRNVYDRLGEDFDSPARSPKVLVYEFLREACEQWCAATGGNVKSVTIALVASTLEYTIPLDVIQVLEVMDDANSIPLSPMHWRDMYVDPTIGARPWRDITDTRPFHYILHGLNKIWIWPTQTSVAAADTVTVTFSSCRIDDLDSALSSDEEGLETVPREFHDALVDYVVGRCLMIGASDDTHLKDANELVAGWFKTIQMGGSMKDAKGAFSAPTPYPILNR